VFDLKRLVAQKLEQAWYERNGLTQLLRPLSWVFLTLASLRRFLYRTKIIKQVSLPIPVIIVGNISVGGTGKTPLVIWIAKYLKSAGYKPGIVSRGYGGRARNWPQQVRPDADPVMVGDEAVVISRRTACPMAVGPDRVADSQALLKYADVDVIISDDGLQHYLLARTVEIAVIDGIRRFGNGFCLPAGPLRELRSRLEDVDCRVTNGVAAQGEIAMRYQADKVINLVSGETRAIAEFKNQPVNAIAGIGNPDRFFNFIRASGIRTTTRAFPDHHLFTADEISFPDNETLFMTEKDAVKCQRFARNNWWYIPVDAILPDDFGVHLIHLLEERHG
jgi:tetraacyldisaccharide 4'-kinase